MKKLKSTIKVNRTKIVNFRASDDETKKIEALAAKWGYGSLSGWVRHAALNYRPRKSELVSVAPVLSPEFVVTTDGVGFDWASDD